MSNTREMTPLETELAELVIKAEKAIVALNPYAADPLRLALYWCLVRAHEDGVDTTPAVERLKETLEENKK